MNVFSPLPNFLPNQAIYVADCILVHEWWPRSGAFPSHKYWQDRGHNTYRPTDIHGTRRPASNDARDHTFKACCPVDATAKSSLAGRCQRCFSRHELALITFHFYSARPALQLPPKPLAPAPNVIVIGGGSEVWEA